MIVPSAQHHLEPHHLRAHASVAQHADAARIGGDHAADGRAVARGEVDAELEAGASRMGLQRSEANARAGGHLTGSRVDGLQRGEPGEAQQHLSAAGHAGPDKPRIASLNGDRHPRGAARTQHRRNLFGAGRTDHHRGRGAETPGPVDFVRAAQLRIGEDVRIADDRAQCLCERARVCAHSSLSRTATGRARNCAQAASGSGPETSVTT